MNSIALYLLFNAADGGLTLCWRSKSMPEANWLMAALLEHSATAFIAGKLLIGFIVAVAASLYASQESRLSRTVADLAAILYLYIFVVHLFVLRGIA